MVSSGKYVIDFQKLLGRGSFADVFLGINSDDGSLCAFKCSKLPMRNEVDILSQLDHENIVRFYESLDKVNGYEEAIVFEYCNRGSLRDFYLLHGGLCDNMFILVLECLSKGIAYLRSKQLLHRDIKPMNMMICEDSMGFISVKIGDLGMAKKVENNEKFETLVGTRVYLNPEMFLRLIGEATIKKHNCSMDLWSIAVTLYQSVTTKLPFIPFHYPPGSEDFNQELSHMYKTRKPGFISCVQNSKDITWSQFLPQDCKLSPMLNKLASKLIGDLMDFKEDNSYELFFDEANKIIGKKRILLFSSWTGQLQLLYLDDLTFKNVSTQVEQHSDSRKEDVFILTKQKLLEPSTTHFEHSFRSMLIKGHLKYELTNDTILVMAVSKDNEMHSLHKHKLSDDCEKPCQRYPNLVEAKHYSNKVMRCLYQIRDISNYVDCQIDCFMAIVASFNYHVSKSMRVIGESSTWKFKTMWNQCTMLTDILKMFKKSQATHKCNENCQESVDSCEKDIEETEIKIKKGEVCVDKFYNDIVHEKGLAEYSQTIFNEDLVSDSIEWVVHLAEELLNEMNMIKEEQIVQGRSYELRIWQRHIKMYEYFEDAKHRLSCKVDSVNRIHTLFYKWIQVSTETIQKTKQLDNYLGSIDNRCLILWKKFSVIKRYFDILFVHLESESNKSSVNNSEIVENGIIKKRLIEIMQITEKLKNAGTINN